MGDLMRADSKKRLAAGISRFRTGNIFSQVHQRARGDIMGMQFRSVPDRLRISLKTVVPASHPNSIFLCFSQDGLLLISYCVSFADSCPTYALQLWESPLGSKGDVTTRQKLRKIADIPLFLSCNLRDTEVEHNALESVEEKHLQIHLVETKCGCFVVAGNWPDTSDQSQRVYVTLISPVCGHMTAVHFSYICYGSISRPAVIPLNDPEIQQRSFLLIVNTVDAFRTIKVRSAHSSCDSSVVSEASTSDTKHSSQFFKTENWLLDVSTSKILNSELDGTTTLTIDATTSLELESVLICWLSRQPTPRCILRDYSAMCVPSPEVFGDFHAVAVLHATPDTLNQQTDGIFAVLAMAVSFNTMRLSINKLNWSKSVLLEATRFLAPSFQAINITTPSLNNLCQGGALLYARQCYLPCSKLDRITYTNNAPVLNHQSRPFLLNPRFPIALVL